MPLLANVKSMFLASSAVLLVPRVRLDQEAALNSAPVSESNLQLLLYLLTFYGLLLKGLFRPLFCFIQFPDLQGKVPT